MSRILEQRPKVKSCSIAIIFQQFVQVLEAHMTHRVDAQLTRIVDGWLGRKPHGRRAKLPPWIKAGVCARCGSSDSRRFSRNGTRPRTLLTPWCLLQLALPRVICQCGGSVRIDFAPLLRPYQRLCNEIDAQIQRWGGLCLSLRQMQRELAHSFVGPLGLRTLLTRLHQLQHLTVDGDQVPPIVQVDAIWLTQLRSTGRTRTDRRGRTRLVKGRVKRPLFIAVGVWPATGRARILAWQLGHDESIEAWVAFLSLLEERGLRGQNGLELIIHDGGSGLCGALEIVHFGAEQQRCLFHKLRNILQAIKPDPTLSLQQQRRQRKAILKEFRAIWQARRYDTALRRYLPLVRKYRARQPQAIAILRRDFRATLAFYRLQARHPDWDPCHLRTTSRLERFNQNLRARLRTARAYHSDAGVQAMAAQVAHTFNLAHDDS